MQQADRQPEEGATVEEKVGSSRISVITGGRDLIASPVIFRRRLWRRYCITEPVLPLVFRRHSFTRHLLSSHTDEISSLHLSSCVVAYGDDTASQSQYFRSSFVVAYGRYRIASSVIFRRRVWSGYCTVEPVLSLIFRRHRRINMRPLQFAHNRCDVTSAHRCRMEKSTSAVHISTSLRTASRVNITSLLCHLSSTLRAGCILSFLSHYTLSRKTCTNFS